MKSEKRAVQQPPEDDGDGKCGKCGAWLGAWGSVVDCQNDWQEAMLCGAWQKIK